MPPPRITRGGGKAQAITAVPGNPGVEGAPWRQEFCFTVYFLWLVPFPPSPSPSEVVLALTTISTLFAKNIQRT